MANKVTRAKSKCATCMAIKIFETKSQQKSGW